MRGAHQPVRPASRQLRLAIRRLLALPMVAVPLLLPGAAVQALSLGEITVYSVLGQRLDARVPVRLASGETLAAGCVTPASLPTDLRKVPGARVAAPQATREGLYELRISSTAALYEPMYELQLQVQCPGAPSMLRQYVLMLDLPGAAGELTAPEPVATSASDATDDAQTSTPLGPVPALDEQRATRPSSPRVSEPRPAIAAGSRHRVVEGDTLYNISRRVRGVTAARQAVADAILAANPAAFIGADPNRLKLGSELLIPEAEPAAATDQPAPATVVPDAAAPTQATAPGPELAADGMPAAAPPAPPLATTTASKNPDTANPTGSAPVSAPLAAATPAVVASPAERPTARRAQRASVERASAREDKERSGTDLTLVGGVALLLLLLGGALFRFRARLPQVRWPQRREQPVEDELQAAEATPAPVPLVTRPYEPGLTVSFTPAQDDPLAAEFADQPLPRRAERPLADRAGDTRSLPAPTEDITSELEKLFDASGTAVRPEPVAEKTQAVRIFGNTPRNAGRMSAPELNAGNGLEDTAELPATDPLTSFGETVEQPRPAPRSAAPLAGGRTPASEDQDAQTLLDALTLLERDYEEELTASHMLDPDALREALGDEEGEPTRPGDSRKSGQSRGT